MFACLDTAPLELFFFSGRVGFINDVGISREVSKSKQTTLQGRKSSALDAWLGSEYASVNTCSKLRQKHLKDY